MKKRTVVIMTIELIKSNKFRNGAGFLINRATDSFFTNLGFINQVYTGAGLSTDTSFQMLKGSTLTFYETTITAEQIATGNGKHVVLSPRTNDEIEFTTPGKKQIDMTLASHSHALEQAIFATGVKISNDWANLLNPTVQPANMVTPPIAPAPPVVEAEVNMDAIEEEADTLADEAE